MACKSPRDGLCLESELDAFGVPLTPEEQERRLNPKKMKMNLMVDNRQRVFIFTGQGYLEWQNDKAAKVQAEEEAKQKRQETKKRTKTKGNERPQLLW